MDSAKKFDWVAINWGGQLLFFLFMAGVLLKHIQDKAVKPSGWIFRAVLTFIFALSTANCFCISHKKLRDSAEIVLILFLIFIIPFTFYALGGSIEATSGVSLVYVLMSITMSPLVVGIGILVCALIYAGFIHYSNFFEQYPVFREAIAQMDHSQQGQKVITLTSKHDTKYYTVRTPATLQEISSYDAVYGNKDYWFAIYEANSKTLKSPDTEVQPGTKLAIPLAKGKPYRIRMYIVPRESTLKEISAQPDIYGTSSYWKYLYEANRSKVIDQKLTVLGGTRLIVPEIPKRSHYKFLIISLIYVAAAMIGLCWRILLQELYRLLTVALSASTGETIRELESAKVKLEKLVTDNRRLRKEVAIHIVEIDQIINYREDGTGKKP